MNSQAVLLVVTFLAAATLALAASVPDGPADSVPVLDAPNRDAKSWNGQPAAAPAPPSGETPDDLKADGFFWGGYGLGSWGGYGWGRYPYGYGRYGGYYGGYRPYGYGGWGGYYGW